MAKVDIVELNNRFTYHAPRGDQPNRHAVIRDQAKELALLIVNFTPASREQALALTKLEEAVFWSNAAIARREKDGAITVQAVKEA